MNAVDRPKRVKNRLHLDVYAASIDELVGLGATVLAPAEDTGFGWTVMADPEGGEFCAFLRDPAELPAYRLHGIGIDAVDAAAQAAWWGNVFGVAPVNEEGQDWHTLEHATPDPVLTLDFAPVPEPGSAPTASTGTSPATSTRCSAAGATRLWDMPDWTVLADPEGNEFCVFPARADRLGQPGARPTGASTATGMVRPARRAYFATSGASASTTSSHIASRSSPTSSRATAVNRRALTCTSATSAARRLRNQSGSWAEPEPVPHTTSPSAVSR